MARSRNIKPSFFTNDKLADCSLSARLLFIGLWTIADREGRLEDRPKKIKAEILPYEEEIICDDLLVELDSMGFIMRYQVDNIKYIQVVNFKKHQNPHMKEGASTIPAPNMHHASTVQEPENNSSSPADSLNLIPLTLNPITDTLKSGASSDAALDAFNDLAKEKGLPVVQRMTKPRQSRLAARLRDCGGIEGWMAALGKIRESDFLTGNNKNGWKMDFDFLLQESSFVKLMEGKYDNTEGKSNGKQKLANDTDNLLERIRSGESG